MMFDQLSFGQIMQCQTFVIIAVITKTSNTKPS